MTDLADAPRRRQIEDAASGLFRMNGYVATSVRDIARALDLQGASLYSHVTSKEDVLWAIVDRAASAFEAAADQAFGSVPATEHRARLAALVRAHVTVIARDPGQASVFVAEWRHLAGDRRAAILERRDAYEARLRRLIEDGMASGELALVDSRIAATFLLTALNGVATWYREDGRMSADQLADLYADLALRTLTEDLR